MSTIQTLNNGESGLSHRNKLNTNFSNLNTDKVEASTTVNGKALSSNVTLTTDDIAEGSTNKYDEVVALLAGAGIQVTGTYPNFTVTNTSPDQVVSLTAGTNVTITGTYPNFTIAATGGSGSGDVTASGTLTDDAIVLGGGTKTVKTSGLNLNRIITVDGIPGSSLRYTVVFGLSSGTNTLLNDYPAVISNNSAGTNTAVLPVASTMQVGQEFIFDNTTNGNTNPLTINSSGGNLVYSLPSGENIRVVLIKNTGTGASSWRVETQLVPTYRTITINGTTYDLSADRSWTISGGASIETSVAQIRSFI